MIFFQPHLIQKTFEKAAQSYDAASKFTTEIADRLIEQLDWIRLTPETILDLGSGTGCLTRLLQQKYPSSDLLSVDFSHAMLRQSQASLTLVAEGEKNRDPANPISWVATRKNSTRNDGFNGHICADALKLPLQTASLDMVVSSLMLPWCDEPEAVFSEVQRVLKPGGLWMFSTLGPDSLKEIRESWAEVDELPHVHLFFDSHDIGDALARAGFADPVMQAEWLTFHYSDISTVLRDLKQSGSMNVLLERRQTLTGKKRFQTFMELYENYKLKSGKIPVTFEIIYGHCWKKANDVNEFSIPITGRLPVISR